MFASYAYEFALHTFCAVTLEATQLYTVDVVDHCSDGQTIGGTAIVIFQVLM